MERPQTSAPPQPHGRAFPLIRPMTSAASLSPRPGIAALPSAFEDDEDDDPPAELAMPARHGHRIEPRLHPRHVATQSFSGIRTGADDAKAGSISSSLGSTLASSLASSASSRTLTKKSPRLSGLFRHRSRDALREPLQALQPEPPRVRAPPPSAGGTNWLARAASVTFRGRRRSTFGETSPLRRPLLDGASRAPPHALQDEAAQKAPLRGGAAARAAAAASNEQLEGAVPRGAASSSPCRDAATLRRMKSSDNESGIGIDLQEVPALPSDAIARVDPGRALPEELFHAVLSHLDADSLMAAELVSRRWQATASSRTMWRGTFAKDFTRADRSAEADAHGGSLGLGSARPDQDFKRMWQVRQALDARWRAGRAAALYLNGHSDSVYCVQFDGTKIVTGSRDRTVRVWDLRTLECVRVLGLEKSEGAAAQPASPPPLMTARMQRQRPMAVRDPAAPSAGRGCGPAAESRAINHHGSVLCLQFDATTMVTGSSDTSLIVWDVQRWEPLRRLSRHRAGVLDVCFDARRIVSCSKDASICVWDRTGGCAPLARLASHQGPVNAVQLRGDLLVSASGDGVAKLWNLAAPSGGACVREFPSRDRGLACVEFSPDSRTILAGGNDQVVYHFDANSGELVRELRGHRNLVRSLHLDRSGRRVVSGSYDYSVKAYDLATGDMLCDFVGWTASWILSAKADYRRIVATSQDGRVVVMDFGYELEGVDLLEGP